MYFAIRDIEGKNLKVKAGMPLQERFQNRQVIHQLRRKLGEDVVAEITSRSEDYKIVPVSYLGSLEADKERLEARVKELEGSTSNQGPEQQGRPRSRSGR